VSAVPSCLVDPIWSQFAALLPERPAVVPTHPLGCHRRRVPDRVVFEHVVAALVHGSGYERIASPGCSERTIRRRLAEWAVAGLSEELHTLALEQYDRLIGLDLADLSADGCITKAPCGGARAGRSPVDRGKQGLKRSTVTDGAGVPLHVVAAGANRHDAPLLRPTLEGLAKLNPLPEDVTTHLDRAYDGGPTRGRRRRVGPAAAPARRPQMSSASASSAAAAAAAAAGRASSASHTRPAASRHSAAASSSAVATPTV
jgi:transposase